MRPLATVAFAVALSIPVASLAEADAFEPRPAPYWSEGAPSRRPDLRLAQAFRPAPRHASPAVRTGPSTAPGPVRVAPAPPRGHVPVYGPGGTVGYAWAPFWTGWSWGFGYYPLLPLAAAPVVAYGEPAYLPAPEPDPVVSTFDFHGGWSSSGPSGGVSLAVDGRRAGFDLAFDAFEPTVSGIPTGGDHPAFALGSMHATWSIVSAPVARLRLELGASMLALPSSGPYAGAPYAGNLAFGPDLGFSGHVGILGPLGFEGHVRWTPYPIPVVDVRTVLALRAGPFAFTGGWRARQISGNGTDAPDAWFDGPELGIAAIF